MKFRILILCFALAIFSSANAQKIPLDGSRWYQLNTPLSNDLHQLHDGDTTTDVLTGYGKVLAPYDAYYPLLPGEAIRIDSVRFYDGYGSLGPNIMKLDVIRSDWSRVNVATFDGSHSITWVGPAGSTTDFNVSTAVKAITDIKYLVISQYYNYPTEMEIYGPYTAPTAIAPVVTRNVLLGDQFMVNAYEWNFEAPQNASVLEASRTNTIKYFSGIRHYMDWKKIQPTQTQGYTFNPCHDGSWNYDTIYRFCKDNGIFVLDDFKSQSVWQHASFPTDQQDWENVPITYGADVTNPASYIDQAKAAFQYVARYGSNTSINPALIQIDTTTRWTGDPKNTKRIGLGTVHYIECDNERDKWWKGRKAYQSGREYAANLSAFTDGNKNTMGAAVGAKNADPTMKVVMMGTASYTPDYVRGMLDWYKQYRGYNTDGTVNMPQDVINYHYYAQGVCPEQSGADTIARNFVLASHNYFNDMPVWITETGYDNNQGSPIHASAIGSKDAATVKADWILRTSLLNARNGIERTFFYQEADDSYAANPTVYATSGLVNGDDFNAYNPRPAANYLKQVKDKFGAYAFKQTIATNPFVDLYTNGAKTLYVITMATQTGATATTNITLSNDASAVVYRPTTTGANMNTQSITSVNKVLTVTATETPQFVLLDDKLDTTFKVIHVVHDTLEALHPYNKIARYDTITSKGIYFYFFNRTVTLKKADTQYVFKRYDTVWLPVTTFICTLCAMHDSVIVTPVTTSITYGAFFLDVGATAKINSAKALGPKLTMLRYNVDATTSNYSVKQFHDAGYKVILTYNWRQPKDPAGFPVGADLVTFGNKFTSFMQQAVPEIVCVENEMLNMRIGGYYPYTNPNNTPENWIAMMNVIIPIAHAYGAKVCDGGLLHNVEYNYILDLQQRGLTDSATHVMQQLGIVNMNASIIQDAVTLNEKVLNYIQTAAVDFVNFHYYQPPGDSTNAYINFIPDLARWLHVRTDKDVITHEFGVYKRDPATLTRFLDDLKAAGVKYQILYCPGNYLPNAPAVDNRLVYKGWLDTH